MFYTIENISTKNKFHKYVNLKWYKNFFLYAHFLFPQILQLIWLRPQLPSKSQTLLTTGDLKKKIIIRPHKEKFSLFDYINCHFFYLFFLKSTLKSFPILFGSINGLFSQIFYHTYICVFCNLMFKFDSP